MTHFMQFVLSFLLAVTIGLASPNVSLAQTTAVVYVDGTAGDLNPPNFGRNGWGADAHRFLQDALQAASDLIDLELADDVEVWVREGTYRPDQSKNNKDPNHPQQNMQCTPGVDEDCCPPYGHCGIWAAFTIPADKTIVIRGGFQGTESSPSERSSNILDHQTILSGDLQEGDPPKIDDVTIFDNNGDLVLDFQNYEDNAWRVVQVLGSGVLDRVTVRGANGQGGIRVSDGHLLIEDSTIEENIGVEGGGVRVHWGSLEMRRCIVRHNRTEWGGFFLGQGGAGVAVRDANDVVIVSSQITRNIAHDEGGALRTMRHAPVTLVNVEITENIANEDSGGMHLEFYGGGVRLWNCLIARNSTTGTWASAGGISSITGVAFEMVNCTVTGNSDGSLPEVSIWGGTQLIANSILWGEAANALTTSTPSSLTVTHSNVRGGWSGTGNLNVDPKFVDSANGDYRLLFNSPAIDAGDNSLLPCDDYVVLPGAIGIDEPNQCDPNAEGKTQLHPVDLDLL